MYMTLPKDFIWGAATSAYQIEGAAYEDGRGLSIWDAFCRKPGAVWQDNNGDISCDHFHLYREDIALMRGLGLHAYRFSIAWPRVLPQGTGAVNNAGLDFYDCLVDELLKVGITPYVTLFHWDYPLALYAKGGWLQPDSSDWFAEYTAVVVDRISDRVRHWFTINEPQIFVSMGYQDGSHAPGDRLEFSKVLMIAHNVLLAHGKAVQTIRSRAKSEPSIGYAVSVNPVAVPATNSTEDIQAARQVFFAVAKEDCMNNTWWADPVVFGRYPEDGLKLFEKALSPIGADDLKTICQPLDFLGLNVYFGGKYRAGLNGTPEVVPLEPGHAHTNFNWPVVPESLYWAAKFYYERYKLPIIISENGMSNSDTISSDGAVHDPLRIDYLHRYLLELKRACTDGIDVRGYFLWSLVDNFEWSAGYRERFGIVYVDYPTKKRIVKDSASWYKKVIASNGEIL
jgi:beta-glucosidase